MPIVEIEEKKVTVRIDRKDCHLSSVLLALRDALPGAETKMNPNDVKGGSVSGASKKIEELICIISNGIAVGFLQLLLRNTTEKVILKKQRFELVAEEHQYYLAYCERLRSLLYDSKQCTPKDLESEEIEKPEVLIEYYMRLLMAAALSQGYLEIALPILIFIEEFSSQLARRKLFSEISIWEKLFNNREGVTRVGEYLQTGGQVDLLWIKKLVTAVQERDSNFLAINAIMNEIKDAKYLLKGYLIAFLDPDNTNIDEFHFAPNTINFVLREALRKKLAAYENAPQRKLLDSRNERGLIIANARAGSVSLVPRPDDMKLMQVTTKDTLDLITDIASGDRFELLSKENCESFIDRVITQIEPHAKTIPEINLQVAVRAEVIDLMRLLFRIHRVDYMMNFIHTLNHMISVMLFISRTLNLSVLTKEINSALKSLQETAIRLHNERSYLKTERNGDLVCKPTFQRLLVAQQSAKKSFIKIQINIGDKLNPLYDPVFLNFLCRKIGYIFKHIDTMANVIGLPNFVSPRALGMIASAHAIVPVSSPRPNANANAHADADAAPVAHLPGVVIEEADDAKLIVAPRPPSAPKLNGSNQSIEEQKKIMDLELKIAELHAINYEQSETIKKQAKAIADAKKSEAALLAIIAQQTPKSPPRALPSPPGHAAAGAFFPAPARIMPMAALVGVANAADGKNGELEQRAANPTSPTVDFAALDFNSIEGIHSALDVILPKKSP